MTMSSHEPPAVSSSEQSADHELKTWPEYYAPLEQGVKTFEFRRDDRTPRYQVGDVLRLREFIVSDCDHVRYDCEEIGCEGDHYTRRECLRRATYVARGGVIPDGFCVMSVEPIAALSGEPAPTVSQEAWVIYSNERGMWWGPDRGGYFSLLNAGIYTEEEAKRIAAQSRTKSHSDRGTDDAIRLADALQNECKNHDRPTVARLVGSALSGGIPRTDSEPSVISSEISRRHASLAQALGADASESEESLLGRAVELAESIRADAAVFEELESLSEDTLLARLDALVEANDWDLGAVTFHASEHEGMRIVNVYLGESPVPVGIGSTAREALSHAIRALGAEDKAQRVPSTKGSDNG